MSRPATASSPAQVAPNTGVPTGYAATTAASLSRDGLQGREGSRSLSATRASRSRSPGRRTHPAGLTQEDIQFAGGRRTAVGAKAYPLEELRYELSKELEELRKDKSELTAKLKRSEQKHAATKEELDKAQQAQAALQKDVEQLNGAVVAGQGARQDLEAQVEQWRASNSQL